VLESPVGGGGGTVEESGRARQESALVEGSPGGSAALESARSMDPFDDLDLDRGAAGPLFPFCCCWGLF